MACVVCGSETVEFAVGTVLGDQHVTYRRCTGCGLIAASDPSWLARSYSEAIARLDVGLLGRNLALSNITAAVLRSQRLRRGSFLDWAGGYGTMTRMMRDRGFDFRHSEPMAENLFARGFEGQPSDRHYDLVTAIEVLEHLQDPVATLAPVAQGSTMMLATTELLPTPAPRPGEWWYYTPETGQHITFYTEATIRALATRLGYPFVATGSFVHLFSRRPIPARTTALVRSPRVAYVLGGVASVFDRRHSLTQADVRVARGL
jgi:hypothetical protein